MKELSRIVCAQDLPTPQWNCVSACDSFEVAQLGGTVLVARIHFQQLAENGI